MGEGHGWPVGDLCCPRLFLAVAHVPCCSQARDLKIQLSDSQSHTSHTESLSDLQSKFAIASYSLAHRTPHWSRNLVAGQATAALMKILKRLSLFGIFWY